ncbi:hypothetical protein TL16_g09305 [Triparma laevis f. inornata]|uniref:Iron-sulfur cluster biosynthesis family protein n=1 Tax=Triparma laevis f. inornata TaxID=1714386 RepID=A0A9W7B6X1_9STRA|nr:hypothetical protein TL16_g09305 [Triparma laevis f. inornata]
MISRLFVALTILQCAQPFTLPNLRPSTFHSSHGVCFPKTFHVRIPTGSSLPPPTTLFASRTVSDKLTSLLNDDIPEENILKGVENAGYTLSPSDLAQFAGCDIDDASKALTTLSGLTGADLKVNSDGDVTYLFPTDFRSIMSQNSFKAKSSVAFEKYKPALVYGAKVSFGLALIVSIVTIYATIMVIHSSSSSDDRDDRRGGRRSGGGGMNMGGNFFGPSPFDVFYYRPYRTYYVYGSPRREGMGFFEGCFSYIFGDGNPNAQLEEVRIRSAAEMIRKAGGAVTSEQLAPFADVPEDARDDIDTRTFVDESFVTPLVAALDGRPEVTDDGSIVYVFPELMKTGLRTTKLIKLMGVKNKQEYSEAMEMRAGYDVPEEVEEMEYEFSAAGSGNILAAGALGVVNLAGAAYLGTLFSSPAMAQVQLAGYFGIVQTFFPLLLGYAVLFNVIPLVRGVWIKKLNAGIRKRNRVRKIWRDSLTDGTVHQKIEQAKKFGLGLKKLSGLGSGKSVSFDTTMSGEEVEAAREREAMKAFDEKFK